MSKKLKQSSKTTRVKEIRVFKSPKSLSVWVGGEKCSDQQWASCPVKTSYWTFRSFKTLFPQWTGSRAREGNSWTHALIMLYFRWYPVVSHFNNPPQLDVLVPSAHHCLVIGPGWEPCWGLTTSTLMESTMRDTHPGFIVSPSLPGVFLLLWARWRPLGAEVATGRGQSRAWQGGEPLRPSAL